MNSTQIQSYGSITRVTTSASSNQSSKAPTGISLAQPIFTFGRLSSNDCRLGLETCSKLHATITVDIEAPFDAVLSCSGVNGLLLNGHLLSKGDSAALNTGDLISICERTFKWESAALIDIRADSPARGTTTHPTSSPRLSLVWPTAEPTTPTKSASFFGGLLSPFRSSPAVEAQSGAPDVSELVMADLMQWDEQDEHGDLITWEEEEVEHEEEAAPATPPKQQPISIHATPTLADRARSLHAPMSLDRPTNCSPRTKRRLSMRMTIVPHESALEWIKEREEKKAAALAAASPAKESLTLAQSTSARSEPTTPTRTSTGSATSRRISALLLSPAMALDSTHAEAQLYDSPSDSSDEEELEADEQDSLIPVLSLATNVPLPASPLNSPTATPQMPRYSLTKRHSLREKVLIRSAIKSAITPPLTPSASSPSIASTGNENDEPESDGTTSSSDSTPSRSVSMPMLSPHKTPRDSLDLTRQRQSLPFSPYHHAEENEEDPENDDEEEDQDESEDEADVEEAEIERAAVVQVPAENFTGPSTPVRMITVPRLIPTSAQAQQAASIPLPETPIGSAYSYTPQRPSSSSMWQQAYSLPLPSTPIGAPDAYAEPVMTPEASSASTSTFSGFVYHSPAPRTPRLELRPAFTPEMTSPVNQHRVMATPKSALRPMVMTGRRKSIKGFLQPPPSTIKRKVVFNESVFVKEIVDIRDEKLHWRPTDAEEESEASANVAHAASVPLPPSPEHAAISFSTPSFTKVIKKAPLGGMTPSESMKAALAQLAPSGSVFGTPYSARKAAGLPMSASSNRLFAAPSGTPMRRAQRVAPPQNPDGTPVIQKLLKAGRATPSATPSTPSSGSSTAASKTPLIHDATKSIPQSTTTSLLVQRMETLRGSPSPMPSSSVGGLAYKMGSPIQFGPAQPLATPPSTMATKDDEEFATPTRPAPGHQTSTTAPTPNLGAGLRRLFNPTVSSAVTPKMNGMRQLFKTPATASSKAWDAKQTPSAGYEGLRELMLTPKTVQKKVVAEPVQLLESVVETVEAIVEASPAAEEINPIETAVTVQFGTQTAAEDPTAVTVTVVEVGLVPIVEKPEETTVESQPMRRTDKIPDEAAEVQDEAVDLASAVEAPVSEVVKKANTGRTKRATTLDPTQEVGGSTEVVQEPEASHTLEMETIKPVKATRGKKVTTATKKTAAQKPAVAEEQEQRPAVETIVEDAPAVAEPELKKTTRGRPKKAVVVKEDAVATEREKPKKGGARSKKVAAAVEANEEPAPEPTKKAPVARKGRATKAPLIIHEDEPVAEVVAIPEPGAEKAAIEEKVVKRVRSRAALKATLEQPIIEPAEAAAEVEIKKPARGRKAASVAVETENVALAVAPAAETTKRGRGAATTKKVEEVVEESAPTTRTRALRARK